MSNKIWNNLQSNYENLQESPSKELWSRLENKLDDATEEKYTQKHSIGWWKYAAVLVLMISLGIIFWRNSLLTIENNTPIISKNNSTQKEKSGNSQKIAPMMKTDFKNNNEVSNIQEISNTVQELPKRNSEQKIVNQKTKEIENIEVEKLPKDSKESIANDTSPVQQKHNPTPEKSEIKNSYVENKPESKRYVKAEDLLFGRELEQSYQQNETAQKRTVENTPKKDRKIESIEILGITIYNREARKNQ